MGYIFANGPKINDPTTHVVLGISPHQIIFGNSVDLQRELIPTFNKEIENRTSKPLLLRSWVDDLLNKQNILIKVANQTQRKYQEHELVKRKEAKGNKEPTIFPVNSYVLVRYPASKQGRGPPTKFHSFWRGPFKVESVLQDKYKLLNIVTGNLMNITLLN